MKLIRFLLISFFLCMVGCVSTHSDISCNLENSCIVYGITSDILVLDPHLSDLIHAGIVFRQIYDTLIFRANDGDFVAGLAKSWSVSQDGLVYDFELRTDVTFHDGTLFTASAVAKNFDRIFNPNNNSPKARSLLGPFSRYEVIDDYNIRVYLYEPFSPFLDSLSQPFLSIASPTALEQYDNLRYQYHQSGTGPFTLVNYLPGKSIELRRNPQYKWQPAIYSNLEGVIVDRIIFKIITDSPSNSELLVNGTVDVIDNILPADARNLTNNSRFQILPVDIPGQSVSFSINTSRIHTEKIEVRQALIYATNRIAINDIIYLNFSKIAWSPLSQSNPFFHSGYINTFTFNLTTASQLLESAGYTDNDNDGFLELDDVKLELVMLVPPWGQLPQVASYLRDQWRIIGIDLVINPIPGLNSLKNRLASGDYDIVPLDAFGFDPFILNNNFQGNIVTSSIEQQITDVLQQAVTEQASGTRFNLYLQVQELIMENALIIPILDYVNIVGSTSQIHYLQYDLYGWYPLLYNARIIINT